MPNICNPPTTLRFGSFEKLLAALSVPGAFQGDLVVKLGKLRWIEALPIAILAAYLKDHRIRNPKSQNSIEISDRYAYLQRMDFFRVVGAPLPEKFKRYDPTGRFVPVRVVDSGSGVQQVAEDIVRILNVGDPDAALVLRHSLGELLDNVFVHARSRVNALVCAQHFPNARRSQIGIVDTGIGFLGSFAENKSYRTLKLTDREALMLGLRPFVTSKPRTLEPYESGYGRLGVGLFIVSEVLWQVGGRILVVSGRQAFDRSRSRTKWRSVRAWSGTIVGFEVPDDPIVSYNDALRTAREKAKRLAQEAGQLSLEL